jgi:hypothetical protein
MTERLGAPILRHPKDILSSENQELTKIYSSGPCLSPTGPKESRESTVSCKNVLSQGPCVWPIILLVL